MTGEFGSGRRDPWRPVPAGRGVGKRFAQPADHRRSQCRPGSRAGPAGLTADFGASPEGVITMISTLTATGAPARNALPPGAEAPSTGPLSAEPPSTGPLSTGP